MFDAVRSNKRIVQVFLVLITLPFALWGVESYFGSGGATGELASVGGSKITRQEFAQALRDQQERLRGQLGREFNPAMLETPEARQAMLDSLLTQRLLLLHATKAGLMASDAQLVEVIGSIPALQENGQFSRQRYEQALRTQGLTQAGFEAKLRQDLTLQQLVQAVSDTAVVSGAAAERVVAIQLEERQVSEAAIRPDQFAGQVKLSAESLKDFYEKNRKQFEIPQQIRAEYAVLSLDAIANAQAVKAEDVDKRYEEEVAGKARQRNEARAKAEQVLAQLKAAPDKFAELARQHSQDPGSAARGGDLDYFGRGAMVKPFEEAVFKLKEGQTSGIVESEFGYHIIRLTGIRKGDVGEERRASHILLTAPPAPKNATASRQDVEREMKRQAAAKLFADAAETFSNMVYEQADSLAPAAEKYRLTVQKTDFFDQANRAAAGPLAGNEKLFAALFSDDAMKNRRNTDAVEVAPNTLVAARVAEVRPAQLRPFEAVKGEIEKQLIAEEASRRALKEGEAMLSRLRQGESVALSWSPQQTVVRQPMRGLPTEAQRAIFKAAADKLPAYAGLQLPNGSFAIYRITAVRSGAAKGEGDPRPQVLRAQLAQLTGAEDFNGYLATLRQRYRVKVDKAALAKGENP